MNDRPYWWDTCQPEPPSATSIPDRVDVLIVGAGYTGLSAARRLAKNGSSVLVVDREQVGWGASSRNGGQVLTGLRLAPETLVRRYGESSARVLFDAANDAITHLESLIAEETIACEYERSGHIQAAWKASHFRAFRDEQALLARVFQHRVELVPREEQRCEIGTDRYHGVLVDERSRALNPAQYVRGLADAARRAGACVLPGVDVRQIERRSANGWTVRTSAGSMIAEAVMIATNGYTGSVAPALQRRFVPVGSYIVATEPLPESTAAALLPRRRVAFDSKHFLYYFRVTRDRRLLFGGRAEFTQPNAETTRRAARILHDGMTAIFPQLRDAAIEYAWGGNVAFTRDELPRAGELDGMYFAGGYGGHGIALATELGDLVARRIAGEHVTHPLLDRDFPPIPLYHGTPWFLPLVGACYRIKDWIS